ncbi:MAG TPA: membrane protein insertase YidC [Chitinivibrionales bacterium]|nr:membrane protein insertase YidC [Chitinivibrionales bacterium]
MDKNTVLAIILILVTIMFFQMYENRASMKSQDVSSGPLKKSLQKNEVSTTPTKDTVYKAITITPNVNSPAKEIGEPQKIIGDTIWIENEKILCGISEIGARIISLKMKEYGYDRIKPNLTDPKEQVDLIGCSAVGGGNLTIDGDNFDNKPFKLKGNSGKKINISNSEEISISFESNAAGGSVIEKRYTFKGNSYKIGLNIISGSLDGKNITVGWKCGITESEFYKASVKQYNNAYVNEQRKVHIFDGKNIEHLQQKKPEKDEKTGFYKWAAITSKYFLVAIVADTVKDADLLIEGYDAKATDDIKAQGQRQQIIDYSLSIKRSGDGNREGYWIYAGPSKLSLLRSFKIKFEKVLFGGWEWLIRADLWFPFICEWMLWLLVYVENIVKDYGVTIIILTIIIRAITFPLSQSSMKSMNRIKLLQPKINHLRERYKTNPKKMNEEIMALYREEGVNPLNPGCLPMFLQMPILIGLYIVLLKAIELRGAHTWMVPWVKDLSQPEILISLRQLGLDKIFPNGIPMYGYGIALMPIIMAILTFIQTKMTTKDPNQKAMVYFMPVFMLVVFNNFPAGLVFYWTFSNVLGILQQYILDKSMQKERAAYLEAEEKRNHAIKKSKK